MTLVRIDRNPSSSKLLVFGLAWLVFFGMLGGMALSGGRSSAAIAFWVAAVMVPGIGYFVPSLLRIVYIGMSLLTWPIGVVVSHLVLAGLYYGVFTPIGLMMRLVRYDPMRRRFDPDASTYWVRREASGDLPRYFQQF